MNKCPIWSLSERTITHAITLVLNFHEEGIDIQPTSKLGNMWGGLQVAMTSCRRGKKKVVMAAARLTMGVGCKLSTAAAAAAATF